MNRLGRVPQSAAISLIVLLTSVFLATTGLLLPTGNNRNVGPGAQLGPALNLDDDFKGFTDYVQSCKDKARPGSQLCEAYHDILLFYSHLVPDHKSLLQDAFAAYHQANITQLCRALVGTSPVLSAIASNAGREEPKYYKTLTDETICGRRCSDLNDQDVEVVRPICKVIAYELDEINKRNSIKSANIPSGPVAPIPGLGGAAANKSSESVVKDESPRTMQGLLPILNNSSVPEAAAVPPPLSNIPSVILPNRTISSAVEEKKPDSITPETQKMAEDIPPEVVPVPSSSVDYTGLIANNNNPEDFNSINKEQSNGEQPNGEKNAGSLDNATGGAITQQKDPFYDENENDDFDVNPDEEAMNNNEANPPASVIEKVDPPSGVKGETPVKVEPHAHNKKPTQVGDSFEAEGHLEEVNRGRNKINEVIDDPFYEETDSNFFAYFMLFMVICIVGYVLYHNKSKVLALLLEGRRGSASGRGGGLGGSRRRSTSRKHTAAYQKLDSNLEEAITSTGQGRASQIIY